jgi:hypothetical protein
MTLDYFFTPYTNKRLKQIKDLNARLEYQKLLYKNLGRNLLDIDLSNDFFQIWNQKHRLTTANLDKWDSIKLKSFCTAKETVIRIKKQLTKREKVFANHISKKSLIQKLCKKFMQYNNKTQITQSEKCVRDCSRWFLKEDTQMPNRYTK